MQKRQNPTQFATIDTSINLFEHPENPGATCGMWRLSLFHTLALMPRLCPTSSFTKLLRSLSVSHDEVRRSHELDTTSSSETEKLEIAEECETNWASVQEKAKPSREVPPATHLELEDVLEPTGFISLWMAVWSSMAVAERVQVASRWGRLMEASGFVDWPPVGGTMLQIVVAAILIAMFPAFLLLVRFSRRVATLHILSSLLLVAVIASWIDFARVFIGPVHVKGISAEAVNRLAEQTSAGANFNRGYCQAWCRNADDGLANILRGKCTNETTVFDGFVDQITTNDWCKQAMKKQNYDLVADFNGTSPFGALKTTRGAYNVTEVVWATACSVVNWVGGLFLLCF